MIKQVIVVRKNLGMRKGKIASQCCHASMGVLFKDGTVQDEKDGTTFSFKINEEIEEWLENSFTKIVLYVNSNEEWYKLLETLNNQDSVPYYVITDNGTTEFKGIKTETCVAIGPAEDWKINPITGSYKLL